VLLASIERQVGEFSSHSSREQNRKRKVNNEEFERKFIKLEEMYVEAFSIIVFNQMRKSSYV